MTNEEIDNAVRKIKQGVLLGLGVKDEYLDVVLDLAIKYLLCSSIFPKKLQNTCAVHVFPETDPSCDMCHAEDCHNQLVDSCIFHLMERMQGLGLLVESLVSEGRIHPEDEEYILKSFTEHILPRA